MALDLARAVAKQQAKAAGVRPAGVPLLARVVSSTSTTVTATIGEETVVVPKLRGYSSPLADDVVLVLKAGSSLYCLGPLNAGPTPVDADPDGEDLPDLPPARSDTKTMTFRPVTTGTYRNGWAADTSDVYQGAAGNTTSYGAAYYGTGPSALGGTAISGTVRIRRIPGGGAASVAPTLQLLTDQAQPAGSPASSAATVGPALAVGASATVQLPADWVTALLTGTAGGIGVAGDAVIGLAGKSSWSPAFELTLQYRK